MKRFILTLAIISVFPAAAQAKFCSAPVMTEEECDKSRVDQMKENSGYKFTICTYTEGMGYNWCRESCDTGASAGGTSSGETSSSETNCAYKTRAECLAVKSHGSCAVDLSTVCYYPTTCASGYYKNTELTVKMIGVTDPVPTCMECPANATCDGTSVFCNSGYTLTSTNPDSGFALKGTKWCILAKSGDDIIDDVKKTGITDAVASIEGECPDGLRKSSDGCCCLK